jgi:excisionase family DNA binding protein
MKATINAGLTVDDVARRHRVSPDKVRAAIKAGRLRAISTATRGKVRFVILPEDLAAYEKTLAVGPPPAKPKRRRPAVHDYFAD